MEIPWANYMTLMATLISQLNTDSYEINPLVDYHYDSYRLDTKNYSAFINSYFEVKIYRNLLTG